MLKTEVLEAMFAEANGCCAAGIKILEETSELWERGYPKIGLRAVCEMLSGNGFKLPPAPPIASPAGAPCARAPSEAGG